MRIHTCVSFVHHACVILWSHHPNHGSGLQNTYLPLEVTCAVSGSGPFGSWVCTQLVLAYEGRGLGGCGSGGFSPCCLSSSRNVTWAWIYGSNMSEAAREDGPWWAIVFQGSLCRPVCYYAFYQSKTWIQGKIPPFSERKVIASADTQEDAELIS